MAGSRRLNIAVGFDGGGTKTDCVVLDAHGTTLGMGTAGPSNPLRVGSESAFAEMAEAAAQALAGAHLKPRQVDAVCAGLAGAGTRSVVRSAIIFLSREFPDALTHVTTDSEVALEAAVGQGPGVVLIAGTGSMAHGRNAAGATARAGGYGRWIGDEGSGYEIGRKAIACIARARDQDSPDSTLLSEMIPVALGRPRWEELVEYIAKNPDDVFPRLVPVVSSAAQVDDRAACEILSSAALSLADMALTAVRHLDMQAVEFPLVKCGGVFAATSLIDSVFDPIFLHSAPLAKLSRIAISPATGAARMAARLAREGSSKTVYAATERA